MGRAILWGTLALIVATLAAHAAMLAPAPWNGLLGLIGMLLAWLTLYRALMIASKKGGR